MTSITTKTKDRSSAKTMSPFEKECIETIKKVNEYKLIAEANAVSSIYKNPDLVRDTSLKLEDITNNAWRVYFSIANDIINVEQKNTLDEITINMYLSKHSKLSKKYDEYGGYGKIESCGKIIKIFRKQDILLYSRPRNLFLKEIAEWIQPAVQLRPCTFR